MAHVLGIGGVFLFADDPASLKDWYARVLGLDFACWGEGTCYGLELPHTLPDGRSGATIFSIQKAKGPLGTAPKSCMVNWRVEDMDAALAAMAAQGVPAEKQEDSEFGRFAWISDPEGNRLEFYQPAPEPGS
jgi:predicted enzyme related to lactoylglutathione lyase